MKNFITILSACILLSLGVTGCATISADFNQVTKDLSSPQTTQAVANLKAGSAAVLCAIAGLSNETSAIAAAVNAKQAIIKDSQTAYVISGSLCLSLGGTVGATVTVPAN